MHTFISKIAVIATIVATIIIVSSAQGVSYHPNAPTCHQLFKAKGAKDLAESGWNIKDEIVFKKKGKIKRIKHRSECAASEKAHNYIERKIDQRVHYWLKVKDLNDQIAEVTPYYYGEPGLETVAIPQYIMDCETEGYYGQDRWKAENTSGAEGPYQLLGHGQVWPIEEKNLIQRLKDKLNHHQIARSLWLNYGASQWSCA